MEQIERLFAILRAELTQTLPALPPHSLSEEDLATILRMASLHDVAPFVALAAQRDHLLTDETGALSQKLKEQQFLAVWRYERTLYAQEQITELLAREGIDFVPLKGAVIRPHYPTPWLRTSCDIDILVREADFERARSLLCEQLQYTAAPERSYHDQSLYSPDGVHLELHFSILESIEQIDRLLCRVWEFCTPIAPDSHEYRMSAEFLIFHVVAHMMYHFKRGGCGIKPFMDLWLLQGKTEYEEARLQELFEICNLCSFYEQAARLAQAWFADAEKDALLCEMELFLLGGGVYGSVQNRVALSKGEAGGGFRYFLGRIFMPRRQLRSMYPVLDRHPWLLPICWVRRWFRLLLRGRLKQFKNEVSAAQEISQDQAQRTAELLTQLEIQ